MFWQQGGYNEGFCEVLLETSPIYIGIGTMPVTSKMELPLAEPISDSCNASGIMYLRRMKKTAALQQFFPFSWETELRIYKGNISTDTMVSEEAGEVVLQALRNLLVAHAKTMVRT
ncbi:hypothetical protein DUI87_23034 [Hirundo rustica rustica]|uniref:Uncharacterized protein n=1 Tax=Hirundo rustica rustica TaxID=333673 RepID=A0A3M0JIA3_HIRRU|nr:hypothetical protein DUI87_23034 [Hirundo rustica rustica]